MSELNFIVTKQKLTEDGSPYVVADSREYLTTNFDFSNGWSECSKTAIFKSADGEAYSVFLDKENSCTVPWEVINYPSFSVSVYGLYEDERITTNPVTVRVLKSGYIEGQTPKPPTQTVYERITEHLNDLKAKFAKIGTAAEHNIGVAAGNIPILNNDGKLEVSTIPDEAFDAVQSDWDETDDTELSFIKNKPTNVSEFENDAGYLTTETDPTVPSWAKAGTKPTYDYSEIENTPTNVSSFTNDSGYLTTETDPTVPAWAKAASKPTYNYSEIENVPTIPAALTDLSGTLPINQGGTGATTASAALANLGAAAVSHNHAATDITSGTLPIDRGGTGATESHTAQSNLGLMKRYEGFSHLTLPGNYTLYDVFIAMDDYSYIEYTPGPGTPYDATLMPASVGFLRITKTDQYFGVAEFWSNRRLGAVKKWVGNLRVGYDFAWKQVYTSNDTVPIANGGTGATNAYTAQSNLGLMKRYTSLAHLTLPDNYTLKDVFMAMANNTYIEMRVASSDGDVNLLPVHGGTLKLYRIDGAFGYAECWANSNTAGDTKWVGSFHQGRDFSWNKIYTSNTTVPIENGGTGATTAATALTNLGAQAASDNSLLTNSKTIVGAINEIYGTVGTVNESLEEVLSGGN